MNLSPLLTYSPWVTGAPVARAGSWWDQVHVLKVNAGLKGMTLGPSQNSKRLCERWKQGRVHWEKVMKTEQLTRIGNKMEGEREREKNQARKNQNIIPN